MPREGFIKDYRQELESDIWIMPPLYHRVWQYLKYEVNHTENEIPMKDGSKFLIQKGQKLTSYRNIAKSVGWYEGLQWKEPNPKTVKTICDWLEKNNMIIQEHGKGNRQYTLISIVNWELYQSKRDGGVTEKKQESNTKVTEKKQLADINKNDKNVNNDKKVNNYMSDSNEYRLAEFLYKHILKNNPKAKEPNFQTWSKQFDYILRIDKRDLEEVKKIIKFSQTNPFWLKNILSPDKLRKQYDRLILEIKQPKTDNNYGKKESTFNNFKQRDYDFDDLKDKLTDHVSDELSLADCSSCVVWQKNRCFLKKTPDENNMCDGFKPKS
jgi:hypothetical protein